MQIESAEQKLVEDYVASTVMYGLLLSLGFL